MREDMQLSLPEMTVDYHWHEAADRVPPIFTIFSVVKCSDYHTFIVNSRIVSPK